MKSEVTIVANSLIDDVWYQVAPLLMKGEKYWGEYFTLEQAKEQLIKGDMQLWVAVNGEIVLCALTTIDVWPKTKYLRFVYIGGKNWKRFNYANEQIEQFAKKHGCKGVDIVARDGWWKWLLPFGYSKRAIYLVKRFEE